MSYQPQPDALRLAGQNESAAYGYPAASVGYQLHMDTADELRRLHAANLDCMEWYEAVKSERDDLLVALTKLVEDLELRSNWKCGKENGVVDCGDSVYRNARAAIAKAIG